MLFLTLALVSACTPPVGHRAVVILPPGTSSHLIAARRAVTRHPVGLQERLQQVDVVPLMAGAAVLAAAGPPAVKSLRGLLSWRPRPRLSRGSSNLIPALLRPDGALEDAQTVSYARRELAGWRATGSGSVSEEALGVVILDWVTRDVSSISLLVEICTLLLAAPPDVALGAVRKATTAASRQTLGAGRDGSALIASVKEERCGALLALCGAMSATRRADLRAVLADRALVSPPPPEAPTPDEASLSTVELGVCQAFGFSGMAERTDRMRMSVASRVLQLEARRALNRGSDVDLVPTASMSPLTSLATMLGLAPASIASTLLAQTRDRMQTDLEAAVELWVGRDGGAEAAVGIGGPSLRETEAYALASRACALAAASLGVAVGGGGGDEGRLLDDVDDALLSTVRSLGLTSTVRHRFYRGYVLAAAAVDAAPASASTGEMRAAYAPLLRRLLSVLPTTADSAEADAVRAVAVRGGASAAEEMARWLRVKL